MPFFKKLKNSVFSRKKSAPSSNSQLNKSAICNGHSMLNHTSDSNHLSVNTFDTSSSRAHRNTLNTTTSSSNPNNTTLSSINSNTLFSSDPTTRNLIIYHIDSETEGDFTLSVNVRKRVQLKRIYKNSF